MNESLSERKVREVVLGMLPVADNAWLLQCAVIFVHALYMGDCHAGLDRSVAT